MFKPDLALPRRERFRPHFTLDERLRIQCWPEATARALGIPEAKAKGRFCWQLMASRAQCDACRHQSGDGPPPASACAKLRAGGADEVWLAWPPPALMAEGPVGSALLESMLVRGALVETLSEGSIERTLEAIRRLCAADDCELFLLDPVSHEVCLCGCVGADREAFLERTRMPLGVGYPGRVTATGRSLSTRHFQRDRRFQRQAVKRRGIHSFIGVPLQEGGRTIGYLGLGWKDPDFPLDWGLNLLQAVHPIATLAAQRSRADPIPPAVPTPTVRCLGGFGLSGEGRTLSASAFPRRKSLDLFRHLLLARGKPVQRDALIERLWPGVAPETGANRLHVALHALRAGLRQVLPKGAPSPIQHKHGHFHLDLDVLGPVDAFCFAELLDQARSCLRQGDAGGALVCLERALPLYRGELFADAEDVAFEASRQRFRTRHRDALRLLVDLYLREDRIDAALLTLSEARERAVIDREWHESLLQQVSSSQS